MRASTDPPQPRHRALLAEPALSLPEMVARRLLAGAAPVLSLVQACGVLRVSPSSPWGQVELRRRALVEDSSPLRLRGASGLHVARAQWRARLANAAYLALARARRAG